MNEDSLPTADNLRRAATSAELVGDWPLNELLRKTADRLISLEAQNQAYRHALGKGVSISIDNHKRGLFKH